MWSILAAVVISVPYVENTKMFNFALLMSIHMIMIDTLMSLKSLHKNECPVPVFDLEMYKLMSLHVHVYVMFA